MPVSSAVSSLNALRCENLLLARLTEGEFAALAPCLHQVELHRKDLTAERNKPPAFVYFPCSAILSVLVYMADGSAVEVGTIGSEGLSNIELLAGAELSTETTICQIGGSSLRMTVSDFRAAIAGDTPLRRIAQRYMLVYLSMVSQSVACNRRHCIEERFARWVLMTHDRVKGNEFHLTQEFTADMLGVHRPSVSLVAAAFQQAGMINYRRGHMVILNRQGLEDACCECYGVVRKEFDRLLGLHRG